MPTLDEIAQSIVDIIGGIYYFPQIHTKDFRDYYYAYEFMGYRNFIERLVPTIANHPNASISKIGIHKGQPIYRLVGLSIEEAYDHCLYHLDFIFDRDAEANTTIVLLLSTALKPRED